MNNAIIFDIDGTLWNACPASAKGWNKGLENLGISERVTAEDIESVAGNPYEKCVEILLPGLQTKHPSLLEIFNKYEKEVVEDEVGTFYDGVINGIQELSQNFPIFLISNCQEWYLKLFLKFSKIEDLFQDYNCHGMSQVPKDEMIQNMKDKHSLNNAVYIGDTAGDEKAAELSNTDFIHVSYGFGKPENKHLSFSSFNKLVDHLKNRGGERKYST